MTIRALRTEQSGTGRQRWAVLAVVSAAQFLIILDLWVVNIALPALQRDFAPAVLSDLSWILDVYAIVLAALLLPAGRAADSIGRRGCFLAGLVVFGVASLGCAAAPDLLALIACRARFSVLQAAVSIAPGPIMAGLLSPFSGRLSARLGVRRTVVAGAALFAAAGAWPLTSAGDSPAYAAVVLPAMLLWGVANALIQPSLFACADAAPRAELASASAVLATARQLGSALGVAAFVAVVGGRTASGLAGFDRAWMVVMITAAITAVAGLATGGRIDVREVAAKAETADDAAAIPCGTLSAGGGRVDC
jgi:MFS family permease